MVSIQTIPTGPFETNTYLLTCPKTRLCAIIDPGVNSLRKIEARLDSQPDKILLTHSHWDHIGDVAQLKKLYNIPIYLHALDVPNLIKPGSDGLPCWLSIEAAEPDILIEDGSLISIGAVSVTVIHTPGHSPGSVCYHAKDEGVLFSGDTLFRGSIGNLSFPTSQPDLMWFSLDKLAKLPSETKVYPGHGRATKIGDEMWLPQARKIFGNEQD